MEKRITIREYSDIHKISIPTVYKQINKGFIKKVKDGRNVFILIEDEKTTKNMESKDNLSTDILNEKIKSLEELLKVERQARERAEKDKEQLYKQIEQANILQLKALETVKQLEYKTEQIDDKLQEEKSKTWFQKLFKK